MNKKILSLICMFLIISSSFASVLAAEIVEDEDAEYDTGESIIVQVESYEPSVLIVNLLEDNNIPVYAYLKGTTIGNIVGSSNGLEPFYGGITIDKVKIKSATVATDDFLAGGVEYYRPNKIDEDTLGYLKMTLKQMDPSEMDLCKSDEECENGYSCDLVCVPEEINLNLSAEIWFSNAERLYSLSKTALVLPEDEDEEDWVDSLGERGAMYSFYGGRGFIRVRNIENGRADLTVYSNKDLYWPMVGAPRAIAEVSLEEGKTSDYINLGDTDEQILGNSNFRLTLSDLDDPSEETATVSLNIAGQNSQVIVSEGSPLFPGSSWTVQELSYGLSSSGAEQTMTIKDAKGNTETITTTTSGGISEDESNLLNKKFYHSDDLRDQTSTERTEVIVFDDDTDVIVSTEVKNLDEVFRTFDINVDMSEVSDGEKETTKVRIESGDTLKEILVTMLPSGFFYSVKNADTIEVKQYGSTDPCEDVETYEVGGLPSSYSKYDNEFFLSVACTAIKNYQDVVDNYAGEIDPNTEEPLENYALADMGYVYENEIGRYLSGFLSAEKVNGAKERALEAYRELEDKGGIAGDENYAAAIARLEEEIIGDTSFGTESVEDNGRSVYVKLISVDLLEEEELSTSVLSKDGISSTYTVGDKITENSDNSGEYYWKVNSIDESYVEFKKVYTEAKTSSARSKTQKISVGKSDDIEEIIIKVKSTDTKKVAKITVTPGSGTDLKSVSNFSIHIPIEQRAIKLNPDKIGNRINKTRAAQEKVEKAAEKLESIVKYWNIACYSVFALVTIKSSFLSSSSKARQDVVNGVDGSGGWAAYCQDQVNDKEYSTYDACMLDHASEIEDDMEKAQEAREKIDKLSEDCVDFDDYSCFEGEDWYDDLTEGYDNLAECRELIGDDDVFMSQGSLQEYAYLSYLEDEGLSSEYSSEGISVEEKLEEYVGDKGSEQEARQEACNTALEGVDSSSRTWDDDDKRKEQQQKDVASSIYESTYLIEKRSASGDSSDFPVVKNFEALSLNVFDDDDLKQVGKVFKGSTSITSTVYDVDDTVEVYQMDLGDYEDILKELLKTETDSAKKSLMNKDLETIADYKEKDKNEIDITSTDGSSYYWERNLNNIVIYIAQPAYSSGALNENYAEGAKIEIYGSSEFEGLPYCLPYEEGNFIKIVDYTKTNEIETIQLWNVGADGHLCTGDDILVTHQSEFDYSYTNPSLANLVTSSNKYIKMDFSENEIIEIDDHTFTVSFSKSKTTMSGATSSCFDVMDPTDCKKLFNACDPVMCPPTRFNLGGRWNVDNVVESGMIGSLVLGWGNGDAVPFCLTGVLSNLKWINSMLEGYVECLEAARYEGETVGVCDEMRSVFICETLVSEAANILDGNEGGLLSFFAEKAYSVTGGSGGEYLNFKENMENMQNSVSYFTTEYATTAFAAFKGRSTKEIGTEICRQAFYRKAPWFNDFVNRVTQPEEPNQFYATLTVKPYAPSQGLASYQTYYHVYAGTNENIDRIVYSVYLRNSQTGEQNYVTEECNGVSNTLELGGTADQTIDCIFNEGMDEVCVIVNGETNCGFGSVTTLFAVDYVKDALVADEAKREINSEKDCYPDVPTASPTMSEVGSASLTENLILPYEFGILQTGVERVCSLNNPGSGQGNSGTWTAVGSCGEDEVGRSLGSCWLNTDSYSIRDTERSESTNEYLNDVSWNYSKTLMGLDEADLLDSEGSTEELIEVLLLMDELETCSKGDDLPGEANEIIERLAMLEERTTSYQMGALAKYYIAQTYLNIVWDCDLQGRPSISYDIYYEGEKVYTSEQINVNEGDKGTLEFDVYGLLEDDYVEIKIDGGSSSQCTNHGDGSGTCSTGNIEVEDDDIKIEIKVREGGSRGTVINEKTFVLAPEGSKNSGSISDYDLDEAVCGVCPGDCEEDECHDNGDMCYFDDGYLWDSCESCLGIYEENKNDDADELCDELSVDMDRCEEYECYDEFLSKAGYSGKCEWNDDDNECVYDGDTTRSTGDDDSSSGSSSGSSSDVSGTSYSELDDKYGTTESNIGRYLITIDVFGINQEVNVDVEDKFITVLESVENICPSDSDFIDYGYGLTWQEFLSDAGGTYNYRCIQHDGTPPNCNRGLSPHSYGIAMDIRPDLNPDYSKSASDSCDHKMPDCIIDAFKDEGFVWGGDWSTYCDPMHFEFVPT